MCECEKLSMDEYILRSTPRLARLDEIAEKCGFDRFECQRTEAELRYTHEWDRLMAAQCADEVAAGL